MVSCLGFVDWFVWGLGFCFMLQFGLCLDGLGFGSLRLVASWFLFVLI